MEWPVALLTKDLLAIVPQAPLKVWAVAARVGLEDVAHKAASEIRSRGTDSKTRLELLKTMLAETGLQTLEGVLAGDYFRLREFIRSLSDELSMKLLHPSPFPHLTSTLLSGFMEAFQPEDAKLPHAWGSSGSRPSLSISKHPITSYKPPSKPHPDVAVKCRDGTCIQAHRIVLDMHSFPLKPMSIPMSPPSDPTTEVRPTGHHRGGLHSQTLPVIDLDLKLATLRMLLQVCYEGEEGLPSDLSSLASVMVAADKHGMHKVLRAARRHWDEMMEKQPLEAYFVAVRHDLTSNARNAAKAVLEKPLDGLYVSCMEAAPALVYHRLLVYYANSALAVSVAFENAAIEWNSKTASLSNHTHSHSHYHSGYSYNSSYSASLPDQSWMTTVLRTMKDQAENLGPARSWEVSTGDLFKRSSSYNVWPSCTTSQCKSLVDAFAQLGSTLPQAISDAIDKVSHELRPFVLQRTLTVDILPVL
ncbi:hypothetical protein C8Q76DRAFT_716263, partial [Earliella scabrosa]